MEALQVDKLGNNNGCDTSAKQQNIGNENM